MAARSFRVELLHAEALPLHLLDPVTRVFESTDSLVRTAAESHRRHINEHLEFIRSIDYLKKEEELKAWHKKLDWRNVRKWKKQDLDEASYVAWQVESYSDAYGLLNDSFFSLVALGFFASGAGREDIRASLNGQSWATKHEILTRWGWISEHRKLLERGAKLPEPYSCAVAHRLDEGRNTDREFYTLLTFLHCLRADTGRELLFLSKHQTPDFILENERGEEIGAEMTETSISNAWDKEQDAEREVFRAIISHLGNHFVTLSITRPLSWQAVCDKLPELETWLASETATIDPALENRISLRNHDLGLRIELIPSDVQLQWIISSDMPSGMQALEAVCETLRQRIQSKIRKEDGTPKKLQTKRPCYLVVYPNYALKADVDEVVKEYSRQSPIDVSSHFDEVWIASERYIARLT